jgi:glycine hydroxymethyltransferase
MKLVESKLEQIDPEIAELIDQEYKRQEDNIELIASENITSKAVMEACGSCFTNKYAEGYPGKRYYNGCEFYDKAENLAIERAKKLFKCNFANVQPHSGASANFAVFLALLEPGDKFLGMDLKEGGHLTHGSAVNVSGKWFQPISYGLDEKGFIDYQALRKTALEEKPKLIIAGASAYSRIIEFNKFKEIADEIGAYLMVDMAHIAGLIAAGLHPSPFPYADVVSSTTHKTLRGPRGGIILSNSEDLAKKFNSAVFPGSQGGPLMHIIAAKAVCFKEALDPAFIKYQEQVIKNSQKMAKTLLNRGIDIVSGGTDNHLILLDLRKLKITGKDAANLLDTYKITVNKNGVPKDTESPFVTSGIRIGTPAITSRGFDEKDSEYLAELIADSLYSMSQNSNKLDPETEKKLQQGVLNLTRSRSLIE